MNSSSSNRSNTTTTNNYNNTSNTNPRPGETYTLSCSNCRLRKVKCTKVYPCPHCVRGGLECIFPARKKDRAPRRNKNSELLSRLAKLEAIVGQVDPAAVAVTGGGDQAATTTAATGSSTIAQASAAALLQQQQQQLQQLQQQQQQRADADSACRNPQKVCPHAQPSSQADPAAKYVSGEFWANLSTEVEGIKTVLEQPSESESEDDSGTDGEQHATSPEVGGGQAASYSGPVSNLVSSAMFGNPQSAYPYGTTGPLRHPPPASIKKLREIYFRNVDMLIKILHRPTIETEFDLFIVNPEDNVPSKSKEALFFAMYFAAITSLTSERCRSLLGEDRAVLVAQYRQAVEVALARADYLNNTSLECLQALTLYDTILRLHTKSRASWALLALVYRLCQAHGLHRDGNGAAFTPYEAEMRRRLWAQIIVLDVRAAHDRGTEPMIREEDFNTVGPTNLDDNAFSPATTVPLSQLASEGPTDVTFSRCTYACSCLYLYIHGPRSDFPKPAGPSAGITTTGYPGYPGSSSSSSSALPAPPIHASEDDVIQRIKALEAQFLAPGLAHPTHFPSAMAAAVVRLTTLIFWLTIQYPFRVRQPTIKPRVSREHMLQTAVAIMELQVLGGGSPAAVAGGGAGATEYEERFGWWRDGYVQWHALAVALAELCVQTEGPLVARAWATVDRVLPLWSHKVADSKRGALWRPIRKLLRKARERRAEAQLRGVRRLHGGVDGGGGDADADADALSPPAQQEESAWRKNNNVNTTTSTSTKTTEMPFPPALGQQQTYLQLEKATAEGQRRAAAAASAAGPSPYAAATEVGPTGFPFTTDFGDGRTNPPAMSPPAPPPGMYQNAAHQWTIDFDDIMDVTIGGEGDGAAAAGMSVPQEELDTMDWSAWNEFVNDANVTLEAESTTPSSEGREAEMQGVASSLSSVITERERPVGSLFE